MKRFALVLLVSLQFLFAHAEDFVVHDFLQFDMERVYGHQEYVHDLFNKNQLHRYITLGVAGGAVAYWLFKPKAVAVMATGVAHDVPVEFTMHDRTMIDDMAAFLGTDGSHQSVLGKIFGLNSQNVTLIKQQSIALLLVSALNGVFGPLGKYLKWMDGAADRFITTVFNNGDLQWFMHGYTNVPHLLEQLERLTTPIYDALPVATGSQQGDIIEMVPHVIQPMSFNKDAFIVTWNLFIQHIEYTCAFMSVRAQKVGTLYPLLEVRLQEIINDSARLLVKTGNAFIPLLHRGDNAGLHKQLLEFKFLLGQQLDAFAEFEHMKTF